MNKQRLDKFISNNANYSRSQVKKILKEEKIFINGEVVTKIVDIIDSDIVTIENNIIKNYKDIYIVMNKPKGYVCANIDQFHKTVFELLPDEIKNLKNLHTVGRLDLDTEGLLIITNDGEFTHNLVSPRKHVEKTYDVVVDKNLRNELINIFSKGVIININYLTKPAKLEIKNHNNALLTITEGKFHQVKNMFSSVGYNVKQLKRIKFGDLELDNSMQPGEIKIYSKEEISKLLKNNNR
ncbi:pseudouridine synthase [Mycoplasmopsis canis UF31]|uniref:pseudouridine synthase n=1 Tax=Mycoplasmopsis canis TaxID=29555 RepID=UPI00025AE8C0|nr:pseudouridine synthase [Mycoplasmopsis canis]EIE39934.1 pseudouridine synthase [Mycoplasmopsis canis UF31]